MDFNIELSKTVNAAMLRFDSLPGASNSIWAEAAARDIAGLSANVRLFRLVAIGGVVALLLGLSALANALARASARFGSEVPPTIFMAGILIAVFICLWLFLLTSYRRSHAQKIASMDPVLLKVVQCLQEVEDYLRPQFGMLSVNLRDARRRMIKTFSAHNPLSVNLIQLMIEVIDAEGFKQLAASDPIFARKLAELAQSLAKAKSV